MAHLLLPLSTVLALFATPSLAVEWHTVNYQLPSSSHGFTQFSGDMSIPNLPHAGTYYIWPGLQPTDNTGVYQDVLDGRFGNWHMAPGWYSTNYSEPWGNTFNVTGGDTVAFNNTYNGPSWISTLVDTTTGTQVQSTFPLLGGKDFYWALFAIELYGEAWDFGPLTFTNVVLKALGTDKSWCSSKPTSTVNTKVAISGVSSSVTNGLVTCNIAKLVMQGPA